MLIYVYENLGLENKAKNAKKGNRAITTNVPSHASHVHLHPVVLIPLRRLLNLCHRNLFWVRPRLWPVRSPVPPPFLPRGPPGHVRAELPFTGVQRSSAVHRRGGNSERGPTGDNQSNVREVRVSSRGRYRRSALLLPLLRLPPQRLRRRAVQRPDELLQGPRAAGAG